MRNPVKISPSILSADFTRLGEELERVAEADFIHVDVMDGHFVPNLSYGTTIVEAVRRATKAVIDVHMMVTNPDETWSWYADAGADIVSVHLEAVRDLPAIARGLHERGLRAGIVINPDTPVSALTDAVKHVDMVLIMSVYPGFGGQSFLEGTYDKVRELCALCDEHGVAPLIEVDGGVCLTNARELCAAGADVLVAGSAVFRAADPSMMVRELRELGTIGFDHPEA